MCQKKKADSTQGRLHWPRQFEGLYKTSAVIAATCGPKRPVEFCESLLADSMEKLCMQAVLRRQGRTEVATGLCAGMPEAKARKSKD